MKPRSELSYLTGFGNEHASEAAAGALPEGRNSPQRAPLGLYAEQLSGTAFTMPRRANRRSWLYRIRPSAMHGAFQRMEHPTLRSAPFRETELSPNRERWNPLRMPNRSTDFIDGLYTMCGNGNLRMQSGAAVHLYVANRPMTDRVFFNADGELLIVPQSGALVLVTEFGRIGVAPGEIAVIGRGMRFRVELEEQEARGYVCENYGAPFTLPELGPIGSNGLANARDFLTPIASYEDREATIEVIQKFGGHLWSAKYPHSPLDVVAWHGNYAPYKYDLAKFMVINTVSFDHPDPSIFTVLTSTSEVPGLANVDFVIFPPRWMVAEETFRPPWFHRNIMSEFMGLVHGAYDAKAEGFLPGGASLHNCMSAHGPDVASFERGSNAKLEPQKITETLAFMFESRWPFVPTAQAMTAPHRQSDYDLAWAGFRKLFEGAPR